MIAFPVEPAQDGGPEREGSRLDIYALINAVMNTPTPPEVQRAAEVICEVRGQHPWNPTCIMGHSMNQWQAVLVEVQLSRLLQS